MFTSPLHRALVLTIIVGTSASAQSAVSRNSAALGTSAFMRRSAFSISATQSRPQDTFGQNVGLGYGVDGAYLLRLDTRGIWSLRASIGVARYGNESQQVALSESVGDRVKVKLSTSNYIVPMSIGPQVSWPSGLVRPYANAGLGGLGFITESRVSGTSSLNDIASTTNHSSLVGSWIVGGGVYMPIPAGKYSVQLDLGFQYFSGAKAQYLTRGSIVDLPGGQIALTPLESTTHVAMLRFGAKVQR